MKLAVILMLLIGTNSLFGQTDKLISFANLVDHTWISEGQQLGGHEGKTVKEFSLGLDGKLIKVKTYTTDPKTLEFGLRNEGIRIFSNESNQIEFYEFDKLGGVSKGVVKLENQDIHYEYVYGDLLLRDSWIFVSPDEYIYRVCSVSTEGECLQQYHQGKFVRQKK